MRAKSSENGNHPGHTWSRRHVTQRRSLTNGFEHARIVLRRLSTVDAVQSRCDIRGIVDIFSLEGKVAIVTGGSRGIGRSITLGYAKAGADLVIASRTLADAEQVADEVLSLGRRGLGVATDVSKSADVTALVETTLDAFGRIDVLVNNAGISPVYTRALKLKEEDWDRILEVNLKGAFLCCQAIGRVMVEQRQGKVINMVSIGATTGLPKFVAYCAAKGGLLQITRVLAQEWAEYWET